MKIIHCADLHLDSKLEANLDSNKAKIRKREIVSRFEALVKYAKTNDVRAIIIAGDMFDTARIKVDTRERVVDIIKEHKNIDFLYLSGNHDEDNFLSQIVDKPDNLLLFGIDWQTYNYDGVDISGIVLSASNSMSLYDTLDLDTEHVNIVVMHGQIAKYNTKDGDKINLTRLKNKNIDYLALGHIHSYELGELDKRGVYAYSGCLEGRGFDECGDKGFVLLDINNGKLTHTFVPFASRTYMVMEYDISDNHSWMEIERAVIAEVAKLPNNNLVKVVLKGTFDLNLNKQIDTLASKLNDYVFFAKVVDDTTLAIRSKDYADDMTLRGEFIRQVMGSDMSAEDKDRVILAGIRALSGEDII